MLARRWTASLALLFIIVSTVVSGCTVRFIADYDDQVDPGPGVQAIIKIKLFPYARRWNRAKGK